MRVIITADNLGLSHEANLGVAKAFEEGLCTQATLIVNSEFTEEAVQMAIEGGFADRVGLHLNLSDGKPLSKDICSLPKYVNKKGEFHYVPQFMIEESSGISPLRIYADTYLKYAFTAEVEAVREEIAAQIQRFKDLGFKPLHVDSRANALVDLPVWLAARPVLKEAGFRTTRCTFDGFSSDDIYNQAYRFWLADQRKRTGLVSTRYASNVSRYLLRKMALATEWFYPGEPIEVYLRPVYINGELIDDFGEVPLTENVAKLDCLERASFFEV